MIYKIDITAQAKADLRGIFDYISIDLLSPQNAIGQLGRLEENIRVFILAENEVVMKYLF